jgi:Holliday junction resolvasome RuvABC endonuclease subunit
MESVLSLDLATVTGWAVRLSSGAICSGTQSFKPARFEGGGMKYLRFQRWLEDVIAPSGVRQIDRVVFEEVRRHLGVDAAHAYGGFMSHLESTCERMEIPYEGVPVGTIKRHATGKGNANKELVIAAMRARGHAPKDDNEADALALLYCSLEG